MMFLGLTYDLWFLMGALLMGAGTVSVLLSPLVSSRQRLLGPAVTVFAFLSLFSGVGVMAGVASAVQYANVAAGDGGAGSG